MRFIRNGRIRERIIDAVAKGILIAFSALVCLWMVSGARAAGDISEIRQQALSDGTYAVDFMLSKPISKDDVTVEYQRNFIQVSIKGVSAYPARTQKLKHSLMEKVFTYQYQPDLARARLLLKGQASSIQGQSSFEVEKQRVRIIVAGDPGLSSIQAKDAVKSQSAAPEETAVDKDEQKIRSEILSEAKGTPKAATEAAKPVVDTESLPLFTNTPAGVAVGPEAKSKDSPATKIFASLLLIVGMIGAGSLAYRRFVQGKGLSFQRQAKMIEVISSQSLGPKRSIALVKVLDQHLVVGMSGDGMNLLANLGANVNLDRYTDDLGIGSAASFTDTLADTMKAPKFTEITPKASGVQDAGFRASLKKRLEGFKPL
jgi:flagellar biogenesis protein FliO